MPEPAAPHPELPEGAQSRHVVVQRPPAVAPLALDHEIAEITGFQPIPAAIGEPAPRQPAPEILERLAVVAHRIARIAAFLGEILQERRQPLRNDRGRHRGRRRIRPVCIRSVHGSRLRPVRRAADLPHARPSPPPAPPAKLPGATPPPDPGPSPAPRRPARTTGGRAPPPTSRRRGAGYSLRPPNRRRPVASSRSVSTPPRHTSRRAIAAAEV